MCAGLFCTPWQVAKVLRFGKMELPVLSPQVWPLSLLTLHLGSGGDGLGRAFNFLKSCL